MDLHELEVVHALQSLSQVSETQLNTEEHMHELLEVDSEVTFRKVMGSAVVLPILDRLLIYSRSPDLSLATGQVPHLRLRTGVVCS